jgi:hypothetical protein
MRSIVVCIVLGLSVSGLACGGGNKEASSAESTKADLSAMDELKAIPADLDQEVTSLTKPIDDTQAVIDKISSIPKRYGINAADMTAMAKGTLDNGKVEVKVNGNIAADAKAEIEAALKQLADITVALKSTPSFILIDLRNKRKSIGNRRGLREASKQFARSSKSRYGHDSVLTIRGDRNRRFRDSGRPSGGA